jgi:hypothetical protein
VRFFPTTVENGGGVESVYERYSRLDRYVAGADGAVASGLGSLSVGDAAASVLATTCT